MMKTDALPDAEDIFPLRDSGALKLLRRPSQEDLADTTESLLMQWQRLRRHSALEALLTQLREALGHRAPSCFISYAWGEPINEAKVRQLEADLRHAGIRTVFDLRQDQSGTYIIKFTEETRLENCERVVLVGTPLLLEKHLQSKGVVSHEIAQIIARARKEMKTPGYLGTVHPIILAGEPKEALPKRFLRGGGAEAVYLDFRRGKDYEHRLLDLLEGLYQSGQNPQIKDVFQTVRTRWQAKIKENQTWMFALQATSVEDLQKAVRDEQTAQAKAKTRAAKTLIDTFHLPLENQQFVHRPTLEAALVQAFQAININNHDYYPMLHGRNPQALVLSALHGLGGVGKSQLALHYAYHPPQPYTLRAWLNGESETQLQQDYLQLGIDLQLLDTDEKDLALAVRRVKQWLEQHPGWLIVYDNVDEPHWLEDYLPRLSGHVLITSRYPHWDYAATLSVDVMAPEEAIQLLNHYRQVLDRESPALAKALGYLPLALAQAGAYMRQQRLSCQAYLTLFEQEKNRLLSKNSLNTTRIQQRLVVGLTWQLSWQKLAPNAPQAIALLVSSAYLDADAIPRHLLLAWLQQTTSAATLLDLNDLLGLLADYSLIKFEDNESIAIHRLVQLVLREQTPADQAKNILKALLKALGEDYWQEENNLLHAEQRRHDLRRHMESVLSHYAKVVSQDETDMDLARVLAALADIYRTLGQTAKQKDLLERALAIKERALGSEHVEVAITLTNLGIVHGLLGQTAKQKDLLERALAIKERALGPEHVEVAITLTNLGTAYGTLGQAIKKKDLLERTLVIKEHVLGSEHVEVAFTLTGLGNAYGDLGQTAKQKDLLERALAIKERAFGSEHIEVALTLTGLGSAYDDFGQAEHAQRLLTRAWNIFQTNFGLQHPYSAMNAVLLAKALITLKQYPRAKELLEPALLTLKKIFGATHPWIGTSLHYLGQADIGMGQIPAGIAALEQAQNLRETNFGLTHPDVALTLISLAQTYTRLNQATNAQPLWERALKILAAVYPPDHPKRLLCQQQLAQQVALENQPSSTENIAALAQHSSLFSHLPPQEDSRDSHEADLIQHPHNKNVLR